MSYVSLILSEEAAAACVRELGVLGCLQFIDLNPELTPFQRRYVTFIKRCEEIERKIRYVAGEVKSLGIPIVPAGTVEGFVEKTAEGEAASGAYILEKLETDLDRYEQQLVELNKYNKKLSEEYVQKVEYHHLLVKAKRFLHAQSEVASRDITDKDGEVGITLSPLLSISNEERGGPVLGEEMSFSQIAGVLPAAERVRFERMLFRATRGNCYVRFSPLNRHATDAHGNVIQKICFIVFYKSTSIEAKIKKICDAFSANRYELRDLNNPQLMTRQLQENQRELNDAKVVLDKNNESRQRICQELADLVENWLWLVRREKGIYHTLNLFKNDVAGNLLRGRGWILTDKVKIARNALKRAYMSLNLSPAALMEKVPESWPTAPTHFEINKFTYAFQEFVNTYGVPRYKEINPALFTAATFPFLFGVMYGDVGHGTCLALVGLYLILTESVAALRSTSESIKDLYSARYMLFGMGAMAIYCGLIYNDYFSIGLDMFGSRYVYTTETSGAVATNIGSYGDASLVYPFGVDPAWKISSNELLFFNSMKMKMSVILGITQMIFGVILKGTNALYFKSKLDFYTEFCPMIIFAVSLFGYMILLIFIKWGIDWNYRMGLGSCGYDASGVLGGCNLGTSSSCYTFSGSVCTSTTQLVDMCPLNYGGTGGGCQPPNLITTLINIALKPGAVDEPMFANQGGLQTVILLLAFICVPWLLFVKPFYLKYTHKPAAHHPDKGHENPLLGGLDGDHGHDNPHGSESKLIAEAPDHSGQGGDAHGHGGEFNFSEIFIHQAIETIEFVLGMVSNTASYLRLWALSLAHTELATVFWEKSMVSMINTGNPIAIFLGYAVFACVTFAVLLSMDVLECFLHALRLHWVEFQNKFYKADGYRFAPFDFKAIIGKAQFD